MRFKQYRRRDRCLYVSIATIEHKMSTYATVQFNLAEIICSSSVMYKQPAAHDSRHSHGMRYESQCVCIIPACELLEWGGCLNKKNTMYVQLCMTRKQNETLSILDWKQDASYCLISVNAVHLFWCFCHFEDDSCSEVNNGLEKKQTSLCLHIYFYDFSQQRQKARFIYDVRIYVNIQNVLSHYYVIDILWFFTTLGSVSEEGTNLPLSMMLQRNLHQTTNMRVPVIGGMTGVLHCLNAWMHSNRASFCSDSIPLLNGSW